MGVNETEGVQAQNRRLVGLLAASRRRCAEVERLALESLDDLAEWIGWTGEPQSLELVEAMREDLAGELKSRAAADAEQTENLIHG